MFSSKSFCFVTASYEDHRDTRSGAFETSHFNEARINSAFWDVCKGNLGLELQGQKNFENVIFRLNG